MRTLRLSLAGAVILALLAGPSGGVVAQDEPGAIELGGSALLDHTMPYMSLTDYGTSQSSAGRREDRGTVIESISDSGDPRLRGRAWVIENNDTYTDSGGMVGVGNVGLDNEDGSWRGTLYGYMTPTGWADSVVLVTGDGDYDGLSAIMFVLDNGTDFDVHGMVYPGELPPFPEMQELPAE